MIRRLTAGLTATVGLSIGMGAVWTGSAYASDASDAANDAAEDARRVDSGATLAEIEACARRNLPEPGGVIDFRVDAFDRTGVPTTSRAQIRWLEDGEAQTRILLSISEPAKTAGTAMLVIDRADERPEFFLRLPDANRVRKIRSRRLSGPVLGTDFSFEDLQRLREPLQRANLELVGTAEVEGRPVWLLETIPDERDESEYSRVLTWVEQTHCLPVRIELFESGDRLRKRLDAPFNGIRLADGRPLPHEYVMHDLQRETRTVVRVERVARSSDLAVDQFTKRGLQELSPAAAVP